MFHKPVCVKCNVELKIETNGVAVLDFFMNNSAAYSLTLGDKWKCPECGFEVIAGFGDNPISFHGAQDFTDLIEQYRKKGLLILCYERQPQELKHEGDS